MPLTRKAEILLWSRSLLSYLSIAVAEYVDFLNSVTPDNQDEYLLQMRRFNLGPVGEADCPVFDGMFEYCAVSPPFRNKRCHALHV